MDNIDKKIISLVQEDFPLVQEPYAELAARAGISTAEFLSRLQKMQADGSMRRLGAALYHRKAGFTVNALVVWQVREEILAEAAKELSAYEFISHCYSRETAADWPYNLYTMMHGDAKNFCEDFTADFAKRHQIDKYELLYTLKEWKKISMKYFVE